MNYFFVCRKQLVTGEELYVMDDTKFVCKEDYNHRLNGETSGPALAKGTSYQFK